MHTQKVSASAVGGHEYMVVIIALDVWWLLWYYGSFNYFDIQD